MIIKLLSKYLKIKKSNIKQFEKINMKHNVMSQLLPMFEVGNMEVWQIALFSKRIGQIFLFYNLENKNVADGENVCYACNLFVHPKFRKQGLGSRLIETAKKEALEKGFSKITVGVYAEKEDNIRLYKKLGFTEQMGTCNYDVVCKDKNGKTVYQKPYLLIGCNLQK